MEALESEIVTDVVLRLIGNVRPIADSRIDEVRAENMDNLMKVVSELLETIEEVANMRESACFASVEEARNKSRSFLKNKKEEIEEILYE